MTAITDIVGRTPPDDGGAEIRSRAGHAFLSRISRFNRYLPLFIFILLATPLVVGVIMPESGQEILKEKRRPAPAPSIPRRWNDFTALPKELDEYLRDRFGLRKQMIGLYANLTQRLLGEGNKLVLVGRRGRMFYLGDNAVLQSAGLVRRDSLVAESVDFLVAMRDALKERGVRFLVASPPNSATVYQDELPYWAQTHGRRTEYDILMADLGAHGIKAVDLRPVMQTVRSQAPAYFLYNTHWTPRAALAGFNAVAEADGHGDWVIDRDAALAPLSQRQGGDLAQLLGVSDEVAEPSHELALPPTSMVRLKPPPFAVDVATGDKPGETIMVIGDSFTEAYFPPMLLNHVGRVVWQHHRYCGFDWKLIDRYQPTEVWWMPTERYLLCSPNVRPEGFPSRQQAVDR